MAPYGAYFLSFFHLPSSSSHLKYYYRYFGCCSIISLLMASFTAASTSSGVNSSITSVTSRRLFTSLPQLESRGGAAMTATPDCVVLFGGTNREQRHFNDLWVCRSTDATKWEQVEASGDIPPPRSGSSMCSYGSNYILLFGGINFEDEAVYNDLYTLNTDTWMWKYVGEAGALVGARNSHTLNTLPINRGSALVLVGGASPEHGPLRDNYFAVLPSEIENATDFFVTWQRCANASTNATSMPSAREMHASVVIGSTLFIMGGRSSSGDLLRDVWSCEIKCTDDSADVQWVLRSDLQLPIPMCAFEASRSSDNIVIIGGFTTNGISDVIYSINTANPAEWRTVASTNATELKGRFGHAVCDSPAWLLPPDASSGLVLFGGVDAAMDYGDCWLITLNYNA